MKPSRIAVVAGLAAALAFAPALSAGAAPVSSDITPDVWLDLTDEIYVSDYVPLTEAGAATFPLVVAPSVDEFRASALTISTPENCTRVVNGMTVTIGTEGALANQTGPGSRATLNLLPDAEFDYEGDGAATDGTGYLQVNFDGEGEQSGTIDITLAEPLPADEVYLAIGIFASEADFVIESASFDVTDDCAAAAPVTPAAPTLAATGTDVAPIVGAGAALLVLGAAATVIAARRPQV